VSQKKIVQPLVDKVTELQKPKEPVTNPPPFQAPPKPAELDQDPGGGFNPDHTYPQP
jgi:hypothetical protein